MYLTDKITAESFAAACKNVYNDRISGNVPPEFNGVKFENYRKLGLCQQHVRKIVEAVVWGKEWTWGEARCCAGATYEALGHKYHNYIGTKYEVGDILFSLGGPTCRTCKGPVGHVMIVTDLNPVMCWQNTSWHSSGLIITRLRTEQDIRGVFRLFPHEQQDVFKVADAVTGKLYLALDGKYDVTMHPEQNKAYLTKVAK